MIAENVAVPRWIAGETPALQVGGTLGWTHVPEAPTCITTEIHRAYKPMRHLSSAAGKAKASETVLRLLQPLSDGLQGDYLFGAKPSIADFHLFVMFVWADRFALQPPVPLPALRERLKSRPAVRTAMAAKGIN